MRLWLRGLIFLCGALLWNACGGLLAPPAWMDIAGLERPQQKDYPDADAVHLFYHEDNTQHLGWTKPSYYVSKTHAALVVLNESGRRFCDVKMRMNRETEVLWVEGRTIAPDGSITAVRPDRIYDDEDAEGADADTRVTVFAFPRVQVGSIIEYRIATKRDSTIYTTHRRWVRRKIPSFHTRFRFRIHEWGRWRVRGYATDIPFQVTQEGDYQVIQWEARDVPASPSEDFMLPRRDRSPRLSVVLTQYAWRRTYNYHRTWNDSVDSRFQSMVVDRDFAKGFQLPGGLAALRASSGVERVQGAYTFVREIPYAGEESYNPRALSAVVKERTADDYEKVLLLDAILRELGVDSDLVLIRARDYGALDETWPAYYQFTNALVYVPEQEGVDAPIWLQPWCSHCEMDQVTSEVQGVRGVHLHQGGEPLKPKPEVSWSTVNAGSVENVSTYHESWDLHLSEDGSVRGSASWHYEGSSASVRRRQYAFKTQGEMKEMIGKWVQASLDGSSLETSKYVAVARPDAPVTLGATWRAASYASPVAGGFLVPASVITLPEYDLSGERKTPFYFERSTLNRYTLRLVPPKGYRFDAPPEPVSMKTDFASFSAIWRMDGEAVVLDLRNEYPAGTWPISRAEEFRGFFGRLKAVDAAVVRLRAIQ